MFHVVLVLPVLIIAVMLLAFLLFSVFMIIISTFGGAAAVLFIKNKILRNLLFIGCAILSFVGLFFVIPFIIIYMQLPSIFINIATVVILACIGMLAAVGIRFSSLIQNKIGRTTLSVIFMIVLIIAASLGIFIGLNSFNSPKIICL